MIALGAKFDPSCLGVLVNCTRQHNGKVISKKRNVTANMLPQESRVLPFSNSQTRERRFGKDVAADK